jgi:outer membrane protein assembly factor BamB
MRTLSRLVALCVCCVVSGSLPAMAWQSHLGEGVGNEDALAVACARTQVVAGGVISPDPDHDIGHVVALSRAGNVRWDIVIEPRDSTVEHVMLDRHGDAVVTGLAGGGDDTGFGYPIIVKLDARTGAEMWRKALPESESATARVDGRDDVLVSDLSYSVNPTGSAAYHLMCRKLSGADGSELWRNENCGLSLAVDPAGDVVTGEGFTAWLKKLSGKTGMEMWRTREPYNTSLSVDPHGDIVLWVDATVTKVSGASGSRLWQRMGAGGLSTGDDRIRSLGVDSAGAVIVAGTMRATDRGTDGIVAKLSADDGSEIWRTILDGVRPGDRDAATRLGVDGDDDVLVAGIVTDDVAPTGKRRFSVVKLDGTSGGLRWITRLAGDDSAPRALALCPSGGVAVSGHLVPDEASAAPGGTRPSFVVARLSGHSGRGARHPRLR